MDEPRALPACGQLPGRHDQFECWLRGGGRFQGASRVGPSDGSGIAGLGEVSGCVYETPLDLEEMNLGALTLGGRRKRRVGINE